MPFFLVIGLDHETKSAELRERFRADHRRYVLQHDALMRFAGPMVDDEDVQCGTLMIFEAPDAETVWEWCRKEPFYACGVYREYRVLRWQSSLNRLPPREWSVGPA